MVALTQALVLEIFRSSFICSVISLYSVIVLRAFKYLRTRSTLFLLLLSLAGDLSFRAIEKAN